MKAYLSTILKPASIFPLRDRRGKARLYDLVYSGDDLSSDISNDNSNSDSSDLVASVKMMIAVVT